MDFCRLILLIAKHKSEVPYREINKQKTRIKINHNNQVFVYKIFSSLRRVKCVLVVLKFTKTATNTLTNRFRARRIVNTKLCGWYKQNVKHTNTNTLPFSQIDGFFHFTRMPLQPNKVFCADTHRSASSFSLV